MYPSGQMGGSFYDPRAGSNYGAGYTMPCCSHGYNYNNYYYPPGPMMMPYQHMYPSPQPYFAPTMVPPMPCHHEHVHHPHHHSMSGTPGNSNLLSEACYPVQQQQQFQVWRPPIIVPQSSCCCACPNHYSLYGSPMSSGLCGNDAKVSSGTEPEDIKNVESVRPVVLNSGSKSSQPQLFWIPPGYVNNLQQQDAADKGPQDRKSGGHLIPFNTDKLASIHDRDDKKQITSSAQKDLPFPIIWLPHDPNSSKGNIAKNRISEIEEKATSCDNTKPLKLLGDAVERTLPPEPVKRTPEPRDVSVRVKDIPVKQAGESNEAKPSANAAVKSKNESVSPAKTSKLPPVCLRVDPLPRKKNGNGTPKQPISPSHHGNLQQSSQNGKVHEHVIANKKEESEAKLDHHSTGKAKNAQKAETSSNESPKEHPVSSIDKDEKKKNASENANEGEHKESVKQRISEETAAVRIQSAYRGYEERKWQSLPKLRQIAKVRDQIPSIKNRVQTLENGADMSKEEFDRQRLIIGETIMSNLLTLDTIQGLHPSIRDIRKSVARELIGLQEKLDILLAQRLKQCELGMEPRKGDAADNSKTEVSCSNEAEGQDRDGAMNAGSKQEKNHEECDQENSSITVDGIEDTSKENISDDKAHLNQNQPNINERTHSDLHQETHDGCVHTEDVKQSVANVTQKRVDGDIAELNVMSTVDAVAGSYEDNKESSKFEAQPLEGGDSSPVSNDASEQESTVNCDLIVVDPLTVSTKQEGEGQNMFSCRTAVENVEILSEKLHVDDKQESKAGIESEAKVNDDMIEHVCNDMEKQPEQQNLASEKESSCEQVVAATCNTCASDEISFKMDEIGKDVASDLFSEDAVEMQICSQEPNIDIAGQDSKEYMTTCERVGSANLSVGDKSNSKAASAENEQVKQSGETESQESIISDNSCGAGSLKAANTESEQCVKDSEKLETSSEIVNSIPGNEGVVIDEYETPRLSNVSRTSTDDVDSIVLSEENEKLRETLRKLMESEKEQLAVISTLNDRLRNLEKKQMKKRNRKLKLQSRAMMKSAHKNSIGGHQNVPVCSM